MPQSSRSIVQILKDTWKDFGEDECGIRAAALSYYTVFALPPLLILLVMIAGTIWSPQDVQRALESQFAGLVGESGAQQIHQMMVHGENTAGGGTFATIASIVGLLLGATGFFLSLQGALNRVWEVKPDPEKGGVMQFITKRLFTAGMVLALGFLLAVSLALTAALSALGSSLGAFSEPVMFVVDLVVSLLVLTMLFAALFKVLPDAEMSWRDVWIGGAATAVLFVIGKFAIGLYLGRSKPGDAFGAASALAIVLVWAYYSAMILLFGAEFTQQWAVHRGRGVQPEEGAVRVINHEELLRPGERGAASGEGRAASERASPSRTSSGRTEHGGISDWILGLPVIYLLLNRQRGSRR